MHSPQNVQQKAALWFHFEANTHKKCGCNIRAEQLAQSQLNVRNVDPIQDADWHKCVHRHPQQNSWC